MKFAHSARDICTNFVRILQIRTNFVRISHEIRTTLVRILQIRDQKYRKMLPGFFWGTVWASWLRLGRDFHGIMGAENGDWGLPQHIRHIEATM